VIVLPAVPISQLRPASDPATFSFETTADIEPRLGVIGQDRAVEALKFGLSIDSRGFNICVAGEPGTGRTTAVREYLEDVAKTKPPPDEWCYINNFADPHRPNAIRLPAGKGGVFVRAMATMIEEARVRIPRTFTSDDFVNRRDQIIQSVQRHHEAVFAQLADQARSAGFLLQGNPGGFFLVPLAGDRPMSDQEFAALDKDLRESTLQHRDQIMEELRSVTKQEQGFEAEANERLAELQRTIATTVVESLIDKLFEDFKEFPEVVTYLGEVKKDMIEHIDDFLRRPDAQPVGTAPVATPAVVVPRDIVSPLRKYEVNLLVDCAEDECATVVYESNPTPQRLFGRIEKEAVFGAVTTDFTMIQPGSLHRANGGYLVFDFDELAQYPISWSELKRTIRTGQVTIEEMGDRLGYIETKTVRPDPIPWTGKIVAVAREDVYRVLYANDPDFREMFKVKADFDMHIDRTPEQEQEYAGLIAAVTKREGIEPFDRSAVARVVDEAVRLAEDHNKLSVRFGDLTDVVRESAYWARQANAKIVTAEHVKRAVFERVHRVNLIEEHVREAMAKGVIVVDTGGAEVGQVNGLSVIDLGDTKFGQPSRITATTGVGREGIIDLQREARLSGPIHSKAVLTLQGFLVDRYAIDAPLTLAARIAFEQNYGLIEGDSATIAETCALLSRLADVPVKQSLAVTGSMDQRGEVQAIGGANQKIEGFFDVCRIAGLTGDQGVVIPASNIQHLMLREDVVDAIKDKKFGVYSISTIDEALELLTGVKAGVKQPDGTYPAGSVNARVLATLRQFTERLSRFADGHWPGEYDPTAPLPQEEQA
jgi:lon-related putative ATP-dependent protease